MHLLPYSLLLSCLLSIPSHALVVKDVPSPVLPRTIPLVRRARPERNATELESWLRQQKDQIATKYGVNRIPQSQKRANGFNLLTNQGFDSSFYGSIAVGTPAISYNVVLDTGSSDLWLASIDDQAAVASGVPTFDETSSSTFADLNTPFQILYGSGSATGTLGTDVVQMAGFQVSTQTFGVVTQTTGNVLVSPVSGLMGLGFQTIAASGATPFWEALVNVNGTLDLPLMAFQLTRFLNVSNAETLEPGGTFTLGTVNTTLFTGDIDYQPIPDGLAGYWLQQLSALTVNGDSITLPSGSASYAAIDTGTTLVSGPPDVIAAFYAQIPGSQALSGDSEGFYTYPCSTDLAVTLQFGASTIAWPISSADLAAGSDRAGTTCVGALFSLDTGGSSAPAWIIGDSFLKNVYSVFRARPPAVGFAQLSPAALAQNGRLGPPPSPTIGSVAATVTGGAGTRPTNRVSPNGAARVGLGGSVGAFGVWVLVALVSVLGM